MLNILVVEDGRVERNKLVRMLKSLNKDIKIEDEYEKKIQIILDTLEGINAKPYALANLLQDEMIIKLTISWEENLYKDKFVDRALQFKKVIEENNINDIDMYEFNNLTNHYGLKLNKQRMNYSKEEILNNNLVTNGY